MVCIVYYSEKNIKNSLPGVGEIAQLINYLLYKHEDWVQSP